LGVAAQVHPARPVVDRDRVVVTNGEDLGVAVAVGASADLLGVAAQADPAGPVVDPDVIVAADFVDGVLHRRADLLGVATQADPAGPGAAGPVVPDGVVAADFVDHRVAGGVEAGADLLGVAAEAGEAAAVDADLDAVVLIDGIERGVRHAVVGPTDRTG